MEREDLVIYYEGVKMKRIILIIGMVLLLFGCTKNKPDENQFTSSENSADISTLDFMLSPPLSTVIPTRFPTIKPADMPTTTGESENIKDDTTEANKSPNTNTEGIISPAKPPITPAKDNKSPTQSLTPSLDSTLEKDLIFEVNIELRDGWQAKEGSRYYVISDTIYSGNDYLSKIDGSNDFSYSKVSILEDNYQLVAEIPNAVTKEYFQVVSGDMPVEMGLLSERANEEDFNFFGWYQISKDNWLLPCEYNKVKQIDNSVVVATIWEGSYTSPQKIHVFNSKVNKCLQTNLDNTFIDAVMKYGQYYWITNGIDKYNIYNKNFELINKVNSNKDILYYEDGTVRTTKEEVLNGLGTKNSKQAGFRFKTPCWPAEYSTFLCNIGPSDNSGYQETEDYIVSDELKSVYQQSIAGNFIYIFNDYYWCMSDGKLIRESVYDLNGHKMVSNEGISANGMVKTDEYYNFYGYNDGQMYIFDQEGNGLLTFAIKSTDLQFTSILYHYNNIAVVHNFDYGEINIYYKDSLLLSCPYEYTIDYYAPQVYRRKNGDIAIISSQRLLLVSDEGEVILDETIESKFLSFIEDGFILYNEGQPQIYNYGMEEIEN